MQSVHYDRGHLTQSLAPELERVVLDTLAHYASADQQKVGENAHIVRLSDEIERLKGMVAGAIELLPKSLELARTPAQPKDAVANAGEAVPALEGHWIMRDSRSHLYARLIDGQLVAPYCFGGNNKLTAVFFDWRRANTYWFARFVWCHDEIAGFAFIEQQAPDLFVGAWWGDESAGADIARALGQPPERSGEPLEFTRASKQDTPAWAEDFFAKVKRDGLVKVVASMRVGSRSARRRRLT